MGWCNEAASAAIKNANNTLAQEERKKWFTITQQEYTKDVPAIPIFNRTETSSVNAALVGFQPTSGEEYYTWNVQDWEIPGKDTIVLGTPQEPASLYTIVESGYSAVIAAQLMGFRSYTSLNYAFQPELLNELPTVENGGALNNEVEAKEGDMVYDSGGNVVALAAGVKVLDATGAEVEYASGTVKMKQLVVTYKYREDIKWQDGSALSQPDLELYYKVVCDKESGATTVINCDKTANVAFDGTSETVTLLPGVQDPLYSLPYYGFFPSNQPIESEGAYKGMTLKDVPAKDWPTLAEVAEKPWSYGPYMIKEWVKGEKLVFEANPYYYRGAPKTPNFVISVVSAENAEQQLLTGAVDVLGSETLAGLSEQLVKGETDGVVKNYVIAGATWEHIDFNLFVK
jgi:ABC-type transport system substrate-binding protein